MTDTADTAVQGLADITDPATYPAAAGLPTCSLVMKERQGCPKSLPYLATSNTAGCIGRCPAPARRRMGWANMAEILGPYRRAHGNVGAAAG
jgi:hypothetical protein